MHVIAAPESFVLLKISRLCENSLEAILTDDAKEIKHYNLKTKKWIDAKSFKYRHELDIFLQFLIHFQMLSFILTNQTFFFEFPSICQSPKETTETLVLRININMKKR